MADRAGCRYRALDVAKMTPPTRDELIKLERLLTLYGTFMYSRNFLEESDWARSLALSVEADLKGRVSG
jgi:hypothetical protein